MGRWSLRVDAWEKLFPHWVHVYGFSPVWILMCVLRFPLSVKLFPHWVHVYGFSPAWILMCLLKFPLCVKLFPHWVHEYGFSPVWILKCLLRYTFHEKLFPQCVQVYVFLAFVLWIVKLRCSSSTSFSSCLCSFTLTWSKKHRNTVRISSSEPFFNSRKQQRSDLSLSVLSFTR